MNSTIQKPFVAIYLGTYNGFKKIPCETIHGYPVACSIHKSIGRAGWSVTAARCGIVICRGKTKPEALGKLAEIVETRHETLVKHVNAQPAAPSLESLPEYKAPAKGEVSKVDVEKIVVAIADRAGLNEDERKAVRRALAGHGKNAGRLLAKSPSAFTDPAGCAAWQGLQPNPFKTSIVSCLYLRGEAKDLLLKLAALKWPAWLDADKAALINLGVW